MTLLFCSDSDSPDAWRAVFAEAFPRMSFRIWPDCGPPEEVRFALVWRPPPGMLSRFPNLEAILVLGAGVDSVLDDPMLPAAVPVLRLVEAGLPGPMSEYALAAVLHFQRSMPAYASRQREARWLREPWQPASQWPVGVMGLGVIGGVVARRVAAAGYPVAGWARSPKELRGIEVFRGDDQFGDFLGRSRVVVNVLPLTPSTRNILDAGAFAHMPRGAYVVNIGRGEHVADDDLVAAIDAGHLAGAMLDVFRQEPLPPAHAFWRHPKITVTPHAAAPTVVADAAGQVIENIRRMERGEAPMGIVDRAKGY
ncbi:MAG TPA: glyoxylate/hydroxypyruvate reductase A [Burkholderiales bacterium]|nr:glyoxylate/hydroxypyruvate reductase A [Burkholderiales bacterium]